MALSGDGRLRPDGPGWPHMALGACRRLSGLRRLSEICILGSYGEIRWPKFKTSRQQRSVFAVSSNNDAKVPLKQMTKFFGNSKYKVSLKITLGG